MAGCKWPLSCVLVLLASLVVAGCAGTGDAPAQIDQIGSVRSGSDSGDSGGSSM